MDESTADLFVPLGSCKLFEPAFDHRASLTAELSEVDQCDCQNRVGELDFRSCGS